MDNIIHEFMPWEHWKRLPENRDLDYNSAMKKYNDERTTQLNRVMFLENLRDSEKNND